MRPSRGSGRRPSPRPRPRPPPDDPTVESWLDGIPSSTTKPTPEELRQWELDDRDHSGRGAFLTGIIIRSLSLFAATAATVLAIAIQAADYRRLSSVPALVVCPLIAIWNTAEFVTMCALRGRGISPRIHVWVDGLLFAGAATATGILVVDVAMDLASGWFVYERTKEIVAGTVLLILMLLHSFLFFFYFCARLGRRRHDTATPRIMYLPTGQAVVVTSRPLAIHRATPQQQVELVQLQTQTQTNPPIYLAPQPPPATATPPVVATSPVAPTPTSQDSIHEAFRQGVPPRKPVAGSPVGTHYAMPWPGPEYQPDAAERERALRGEKQAQWMTLHGMGLERDSILPMGDPNKTRAEDLEQSTSAGKARLSPS